MIFIGCYEGKIKVCGDKTESAPSKAVVSQLVSYADDFICMTQYMDEARHIEQEMRDRFAKFDLELHPEKTRIINLSPERVMKF